MCYHSLRILFCKNIKLLPEKYILKRWIRHAQSDTIIDHGGKPINVDPRLKSSKQYKQQSLRLLRLAHDVSHDKA